MSLSEAKDKFLDSLADKVDKREVKLRNKDINLELPLHLLDIPIIGGMLYMISRLRAGLFWRRRLNQIANSKLLIKEEIKNKRAIYTEIYTKIYNELQSKNVVNIQVKVEYIGYMLDVLNQDFPNVEVLNTGEGKFTLISRKDDQI